jgi:HAD superfamily hydrolase (TIGR01509 family)
METETLMEGACAVPEGASQGGFVAAVIFDMDGLLLNTEVLAREALRLAGIEVDLPMNDLLCQRMIGVPADASRRLLHDEFGNDAPVDELLAAATRRLAEQIDAGLMLLKPGVKAMLDRLDQWRMPRAVATSSARPKALHHLEAAGIADRFDLIVTRDDVPRGKPFPDIYLEAARRLDVAPGRCLALEDSYNGVRAASSAAIPVVMVPDLLPPTPEMHRLCLMVADDLQAVLGWLESCKQAFGPAIARGGGYINCGPRASD